MARDPGAGGGPIDVASDHGRRVTAAFFDVDNTMLFGASIYLFAKGLAARKFFTWRDLKRFGMRQIRLRLRGESHAHMHQAREMALAFVAGKDVAEMVSLGEAIYDETVAGRICAGTLALARAHLAAGDEVWLVTATAQELAQIIADRLGLTGALGTVTRTAHGKYTGELAGEVLHGKAKARAVAELARRKGLDLAHCHAYSDSINDTPLLRLVGNPVAVNADAALRAEARILGWPRHDFRTGHKTARVALPALAVAGATALVALAGRSVRRHLRAARWRVLSDDHDRPGRARPASVA